jgi:hypothetical protein
MRANKLMSKIQIISLKKITMQKGSCHRSKTRRKAKNKIVTLNLIISYQNKTNFHLYLHIFLHVHIHQ